MEANFLLPDVGNPQGITLEIEFNGQINSSTLEIAHAKMPHNHLAGFIPYKDDGGVDDYTHLFKYLQGQETGDGQTYPLWTFSDGCGSQLPAKFSIALNCNESHDVDSGNPSAIKWPELELMFAKQTAGLPETIGHRLTYPSNHGFAHGGPDRYQDIVKNSKVFFDRFGLLSGGGTVPGAEQGYAHCGPLNHVPIWMSEWGVTATRDGYPIMTKMFPTLISLERQLCTRYYCGNTMDATALSEFTNQVNQHYAQCTGIGDAVGYLPYFYHGTNTAGGSMSVFDQMRQAISGHANYNTAGVYSIQEALDYEVVRRGVYRTVSVSGNKLYIYLSYSGIDRHLQYLNASLLISNAGASMIPGRVRVISDIPGFSTTINPSTGLLNLYAENPIPATPYQDTIPPQLLSAVSSASSIALVYDQAITQSALGGYGVIDYADPNNGIDNPVVSITGSGVNWTLACTNPVTTSHKLYYRAQSGDAASALNPQRKVQSYIRLPIA